MRKLYVVVRGDLPTGLQAAQALHAARQYAAHYPVQEQQWFNTSNTVALLTVSSEAELKQLCTTALQRCISYAPFHEPDLDGALTAVAFEPTHAARRLCGGLTLLGRQCTRSCRTPAPATWYQPILRWMRTSLLCAQLRGWYKSGAPRGIRTHTPRI